MSDKSMRKRIKDRAKDVPGAMKAPATNLTLVGLGGTALAGVLTIWEPVFNTVFGSDASEATRRSVFIALLTAFTLITVADLVARAITSAAHERASGHQEIAPEVEVRTDQAPEEPDALLVLLTELVKQGVLRPDGKGGISVGAGAGHNGA